MDKCYMVQERHIDQVDRKLTEVRRRAEKIGQSFSYGYQLASYTVRVLKDCLVNLEGYRNTKVLKKRWVLKTAPVAILHIQAAPVVLNGWTLAAVLEPVDADNNMVRAVPGTEPVSHKWRTTVGWCDHCETTRFRKKTYVVRHAEDGEKSVGSTCLQDFLGRDVHAQLSYIDYLAQTLSNFSVGAVSDLDPDDPANFPRGGWGDPAIATIEWLAFVALEIREGGWLSKGAAYETGRDGSATADCAMSNWCAFADPRHPDHFSAVKPTDGDHDKAAAALLWVRSGADNDGLGDSEYAHNLRLLCGKDEVSLTMRGATGITASLFVCYERYLEREIERKRKDALPPSYHVGEIKKRQNFDVEVASVRSIGTDYGVTTIYKFIMDDGPILTWFSSRVIYIQDDCPVEYGPRQLDKGDRLTIKATVKAHSDYKGIPQTIITRGVIQEVVSEQGSQNQNLHDM